MTRRSLVSLIAVAGALVLVRTGVAAPGAADAKSRPAANAPRAAGAGAAANAGTGAGTGAGVGGGGANALPTTDEIHELFKDQKYKETLQRLSRVLALKGEAAKAYDRHDLLRLRGETQLKLRDTAGAATSFEQAAKEAPDDKARAVDMATQAVIKRSKNLTFTASPKKGAKTGAGAGAGAAVPAGAGEKAGEKSGPIDIGDPEKRPDAFAVLFAEQKAEVEPKIKAAKDAKSLPPVVEALQAAGGLRNLELAATGDDAQVKGMMEELTGRAQKMMAGAVKDMTDTVAQIEESANRLQEVMTPVRIGPGGVGGGGAYAERSYKKRGLTTPDVQDLRRVIGDCKKLVPAAKELVDKLGDSGEPFKQIGKDAVDVGNHAQKVLTTDYADSYTRSPRSDRERRRL